MAPFTEETIESLARPRNLLLIIVAVFILAFAALIPWKEIEEASSTWLRRSTGAQLQMNNLGWAFPLGLKASDTTLDLPEQNISVLTCDSLRVTPAWLSLIQLSPAISFTCRNAEGSIAGTYATNGNLTVDLNRWATTIPVTKDGKTTIDLKGLSGQIRLNQQGQLWRPLSTDLTSEQLHVTSNLLPSTQPIVFEKVQLTGEGDTRLFKLTRIDSQGALTASGQATVRWLENAMSGNWQSQVVVSPGPNLPKGFQEMLPLISKKQPDGRYLLRHRTPFKLN